jgi:hypothetical protein
LTTGIVLNAFVYAAELESNRAIEPSRYEKSLMVPGMSSLLNVVLIPLPETLNRAGNKIQIAWREHKENYKQNKMKESKKESLAVKSTGRRRIVNKTIQRPG